MRVPSRTALGSVLVLALLGPARASVPPLVIQIPPDLGSADSPDGSFRYAALCFSPDGSRLLTTAHGHVAIWDAATGKPVFELADDKAVKVFGWTAQDGHALFVRENTKCTLRDPATGAELAVVKQLPTGLVSPDGAVAVSPSALGSGMSPVSPPAQDKRPVAKPPTKAPPKSAWPKAKSPARPSTKPAGAFGQPSNKPPAKQPAGRPAAGPTLTPEEQEEQTKQIERLFPDQVRKQPGKDGKPEEVTKRLPPSLYVRDAKTGAKRATLDTARVDDGDGEPTDAAGVRAFAFSPDSGHVAAVLEDGTLNIWALPAADTPKAPVAAVVIATGLGSFEGSTPGTPGNVAWTSDGSKVVLTTRLGIVVADPGAGTASLVSIVGGGDLLPGEPAPPKETGKYPQPSMHGGTPSPDGGVVDGKYSVAPDLSRVIEFRTVAPREDLVIYDEPSTRLAVYRASGDGYEVVGRIAGPDREPIVGAVFSPDASRVALETARGTVYVYAVADLDAAAVERSKLSQGTAGDLREPNPLYQSWESIGPGTRVEFAWARDMNGQKSEWTEVVLLEERDATLGLTTRTFDKDKGPPKGDPGDLQPNLSRFDIPPRVRHSEAAKGVEVAFGGGSFRRAGGKQAVKVGDRTFQCEVYERWPEDGGGVTQKTKYWVCADAPGFVVRYEDDFVGPGGKSHETKVMSAIVPK